MKKTFYLLFISFIFCLASCNLMDGSRTSSFTFNVDKAFLSDVRNSSRSLNYIQGETIDIVITLSGGTSQKKTLTTTLEDLIADAPHPDNTRERNNSITFNRVPLGVPFDILVEVYDGSELFYSASKENVVIRRRRNDPISLILKEMLNTEFVLYTPDSTNANIKNWFTSRSLTGSKPERTEQFFDFCFTNAGDIIYSSQDQILCDNPNIEIEGAYYGINDSIYLAYDSKNNALYSTNQGQTQLSYDKTYGFMNFFTVHKFIETNEPRRYKTYNNLTTSGLSISPNEFAGNYKQLYIQAISAWDDNIYYAVKAYNNDNDENCDFLIIQYLASELVNDDPFMPINEEFSLGYQGFVKFSDLSRENATITDMICLDGYCYVLIKESNAGMNQQNKTISRGMIAKINCSTLAVTTNGFSNITTYSSPLKTAWATSDDPHYLVYIDNQGNSLYYGYFNTSNYIYAGPSSNEKNTAFFGPDKFIAIKPKKLVVSDTGTFVWTNKDGAIAKKNINRVVYVDLNSLSITENTDISADFAEFSTVYPCTMFDMNNYGSGFDKLSSNSNGPLYYRYDSGTSQFVKIEATNNSIKIIPEFLNK